MRDNGDYRSPDLNNNMSLSRRRVLLFLQKKIKNDGNDIAGRNVQRQRGLSTLSGKTAGQNIDTQKKRAIHRHRAIKDNPQKPKHKKSGIV